MSKDWEGLDLSTPFVSLAPLVSVFGAQVSQNPSISPLPTPRENPPAWYKYMNG